MSTLQELLREESSNKRKKLDKQQSQINKCQNEKRRREQENVYIEELAELITVNVADMSSLSVKPDKCAILQETVHQIRRIKQESGPSDAVQQSQVSSSKPAVLANDVLGPLLLEALDGFLFVVNNQAKVDFVSENVSQYLKYTQEDLVSKSIYNIIHVGDHAQFSTSLRPMSLGSGVGIWAQDIASNKSRTFNCRMLIKALGEDDLEVKQTQVQQYENMQITAVLQPYPSDKDADSTSAANELQSCLVCIARRIGFVEKANSMLGVEQFTTKQDLSGKIIAFDTSGIQPSHYNYPEFVGQNIQDFAHVNDAQLLSRHHQEVLQSGSSTSQVFRFKLQENRYVFVQTKSKLFTSTKPEFIMSTHSIIRECDTDIELKGSASTSLMKSIIGQSSKSRDQDLGTLMQRFPGKNLNSPLMTRGSVSNMDTLALGGNLGGIMGLDNSSYSIGGQSCTDSMPNLDDVMDLLTNPSAWDSNPRGPSPVISSSTTTFPAPAASLSVSANMHTPMTQVSWSNMSGLSQTSTTQANAGSLPVNSAFPLNQTRHSMKFTGRNLIGLEKGPTSPGFAAKHSPGFATQKSPGFNMNMNSPSPLGNQRTTPIPAGFQQPRTPVMSPSPVSASQPSWQANRTSQKSPLQALQSMEAKAGPNTLPSPTFPGMAHLKLRPTDERPHQVRQLAKSQGISSSQLENRTQLRQLLMKDEARAVPTPSSPKITTLQGLISDLPLQPQEFPGQSPSSTSLDHSSLENDPDSSKDGICYKERMQDHKLLKQLLSREEENPEDVERNATDHVKELLDGDDSGDKDGERNEAEPKQKTDNTLLKALLNDEKQSRVQKTTECTDSKKTALLEQLLMDDDKSDEDIAIRPESTNMHDIPYSSPGSIEEAQTPHNTFPNNVSTCSDGMCGTSDSNLNRLLPSPGKNINAQVPSLDKETILKGNNFENFLSAIWDKQTEEIESRGKKRKAEEDVAISANETMAEEVGVQSGGAGPSKLSQKNVLLAQLLSKKATREAVVNTHHTVNPASTPQTALPKNLMEKIIDTKASPGEKRPEQHPPDSTDNLKEIAQTPTDWDSPQTDPNTPFPGNTTNKDNNNLKMGVKGRVLNSDVASSNSSNVLDQHLHHLLSSGANQGGGNNGAANDPLLSQILQEVSEIHQSPGSTINFDQPMTDDSNLIQQLEQALKTSNLPLAEIDNLLGINSSGGSNSGNPLRDMNEQMAIDAIQQQLMNIEPETTTPASASSTSVSPTNIRSSVGTARNTTSTLTSFLQGVGQNQGAENHLRHQLQQLQQQQQQQQQQQHPPTTPQPPGFNQNDNLLSPPYTQPGPRFPQPQGVGLQGSLQPGMGNQFPAGAGHTTMGMQVRQSLLMKQKQKQAAAQLNQQRIQQAQHEKQRLLLQQQRQQFGNQPFNQQQQQFMQGNLNLENMQTPTLPENFSELMNTSMAPNVSLQRNQSIPGPMSPPFGNNEITGQQQPPTPGSMGQMVHGSNRTSPFAASPQQGWNQRPRLMQQQSPNFNSMRAPSIPNAEAGARFRFNDPQFANNAQIGILQQQMFNQNRQLMQRSLSIPTSHQAGHGVQNLTSPRAQLSPYAPNQDPMVSPHGQKLSPTSLVPQPQQLTPPYQQMPNSGAVRSPITPQSSFATSTMTTSPNSMNSFEPRSTIHTDSLSQERKAQLGAGGTMTTASNSTSSFVKKELRAICQSRSQNQQQMSTSSVDSGLSMEFDAIVGEIPMDVLESIDELTRQTQNNRRQQTPNNSGAPNSTGPASGIGPQNIPRTSSSDDVPDLLNLPRDARRRYEQFRVLSGHSQKESEDPETRATSLFRNQLLVPGEKGGQIPQTNKKTPQKSDVPHVNVVQAQPRTIVEEVKPAEHQRNSLLQQLLSE